MWRLWHFCGSNGSVDIVSLVHSTWPSDGPDISAELLDMARTYRFVGVLVAYSLDKSDLFFHRHNFFLKEITLNCL